MVRSDIMAEVWMGKVFIGDGSLLVVSRPKMENINKADTMRHNGHNTPPWPQYWVSMAPLGQAFNKLLTNINLQL